MSKLTLYLKSSYLEYGHQTTCDGFLRESNLTWSESKQLALTTNELAEMHELVDFVF